MPGQPRLPRARGVFSQTFGHHPKRRRSGDNACAQATMFALGQRRLARAFMSRAGFARPNCEYDKKFFWNLSKKSVT